MLIFQRQKEMETGHPEDEPLLEAFCEFLARQKVLKYQEIPSEEDREDGGLKESAETKRVEEVMFAYFLEERQLAEPDV